MKTIAVNLFLCFIAACSFAQHPAFTVKKAGAGTAVLLLPGFATPGSVWNETIANLVGDYETHTVTYAGFNSVAAIDTPWYSEIKSQLLEYISKNNISGLVIIGHSMGGTLAVDLAGAMPSKVSRLVLVDALPCMRDMMMPGVTADQVQYNSPYNNQTLNMSPEAFRNTAAMMAGYMTKEKNKSDSVAKWIMEADRKTYVYGYTDLLKLDLRDSLKKVTAKTLILGASIPYGDVAKQNLEKQYGNLKEKTIILAPESKHFIMFDQPVWFYEQVNAFLR